MLNDLPPSMLHSSNLALPQHFWSWTILTITIALLFYMAQKVIKEKTTFEEEGRWIKWIGLNFFIPSWWSEKNKNEKMISFHRSDTNYDWFFSIETLPLTTLDAAKNFYLTQEQIILDEDAVSTENKEYLLKDAKTLNLVKSLLRIEGCGTQAVEERIYLDITWIETQSGKFYQFVSKSSVLSGGIEGPYVEEVLKRIEIF